ncbi:hypothetical protein [Thermococcus sp.]
MRAARLLVVLLALIALGSVLRMEGGVREQGIPSPDEVIGFYEAAAGHFIVGSIKTVSIEGSSSSTVLSEFCGFVNSSSPEGVLLLRSFRNDGSYESYRVVNWSGKHAVFRRFLRVNGTVLENFTDKRPLDRFPDPIISYLQMGFNGSKILHAECSQGLCVLSFEKSWSLSSREHNQTWHVSGRIMVDNMRPVEGRMNFTVSHITPDRKWMESTEVYFEITYGRGRWRACLPELTSAPTLSDT